MRALTEDEVAQLDDFDDGDGGIPYLVGLALAELRTLREQSKLLRLSLVEETQTRLRMEEALANESLKRITAEQAYTALFAQMSEAD